MISGAETGFLSHLYLDSQRHEAALGASIPQAVTCEKTAGLWGGVETSRLERRVPFQNENAASLASPLGLGMKTTLPFPLCLPQRENEAPVVTSSSMEFLGNHGKNILLSNNNLTATRVSSYNQGIVVVAPPLPPQQLCQVGESHNQKAEPPPPSHSPLAPVLPPLIG